MKICALVTPVRSFEDQKLTNEIFTETFVTEVLITRTSYLSPSVENVTAYFVDTEMFPEV